MSKNEKITDQRHTLSHVLAAAVLELFPEAKTAMGPATDNGFYYDFDFGEEKIREEDLRKIEKKMKEILPTFGTPQEKKMNEKEAREYFKDNPYKLELIDELTEAGESLTFYASEKFTDLCKGGHVSDIKDISPDSFVLSHIAGAYWRGDENNKMLTRIYGLAFSDKKELDEYLDFLEKAKERDHRKIGKEMDLFTFSDAIGPGLPLWTPRGTAMRDALLKKLQDIQKKYGFEHVTIPHITKPTLYEKSGHAQKFGEELLKVKSKSGDFVLKPMNCPHHTQIFASSAKSYRDLPARYSEVTMVYRDEQKGELLGLSRVLSITQDDAHVFCTPEQVKDEITKIVYIVQEFYTALGLYEKDNFRVFLSTDDPKEPEKYIGSKEEWDKAKKILEEVAKEEDLPYSIEIGEAAFYGPKLDFMFKDAIGREWQLATVQLDFSMPKRFELEYTDKDGKKKTPVMIHRAVAGSLERFFSVLIEHFAGFFPFWLAPVQMKVISIGGDHKEYAQEIHNLMSEKGYRVELDNSDENLSKKIRNAKKEKVPFLLVVGNNEMKNNTVTLEGREGKIGEKTPKELLELLEQEQ
ncbi:MAG: threonine--tRNA ligase [Candidatus Paceibacterota bacterium]